jgi:hypothetical protein
MPAGRTDMLKMNAHAENSKIQEVARLRNYCPERAPLQTLALTVIMASTAFLVSSQALAAAPHFNNISQGDFDRVTKEFSANDNLNDVMPASSLGTIFGFELGLIGGLTKTPGTNAVVQSASPGTEVSQVPHVGLLGAVSVPFGFTGEVSFLPASTVNGVTDKQLGAALKWTFSDVLPSELPVNFAVRGFVTSSEYSFANTIQNSSTFGQPVNTTATYTGTVTGIHLLASPKIPLGLIEPYIGFGAVSGKGHLGVSGTTTGVLFTDSQSQSGSSSSSGSELLVGINAQLLVLVLGAEYTRSFGTDTFTGKLSFRF